MARGGARPGAGRKPGLSIRDLVSEADKKQFIEFILENYMADMRLAVWFGDHLFGKAPQAITGPDGGPVQVQGIDITFKGK
jgi:hypothetical protein